MTLRGERRRTFTGRVARATALTAALAATAAASLSGLIAHQWMLAREDAHLRGTAATLAREIAETPGDARSAGARAADENAEAAPEGVRLALYEGDRWLGGDPALRLPSSPGCANVDLGRRPWRRCVVTLDARGAGAGSALRVVVVAGDAAPLRAQRGVLIAAALVAAALAALGGLGASRVVSSRIVGPLARLRASVAEVRAEAPGDARLQGAEGYEEIDALHGALTDLLGRLDGALAQSRRFAADAAHELRTPLATMQAELELATEGEPDGPELRAAVDRLRRTLAGLSTRLERLLILATPLESLRFPPEAVSLADVARDAVEALGAARRARVEVDADEDAVVRGDATLLRVMFDNALDNALKFAPGGTVRVEIAFLLEPGVERLVLRVEDDGPGVPAAERKRVFEPFYRTPGARAGVVQGYGVGLALVAHVAQAHGGTAGFEDRPRGAALRVVLPRWRPDART